MDDKFWSKLEFNLGEIRDLLNMRLESVEDAVGEQVKTGDPAKGKKAVWRDTSPRWDDHGVSDRPWLLVPYIHAIDQDALKQRLKAGRQMLSSVEARVAARELSPELVRDWGRLNRWAGALEIVYHARPDPGRLREGSNHLDEQKRWFAHHFLAKYRRGTRPETMEALEATINDRFNALEPGPEKEWFGKFLSDKPSLSLENARRLTGAFTDLSAPAMKAILKDDQGPIPYLEPKHPHP